MTPEQAAELLEKVESLQVAFGFAFGFFAAAAVLVILALWRIERK